jgi:hypothetical protein
LIIRSTNETPATSTGGDMTGTCLDDNFDSENGGLGVVNYGAFTNWNIEGGSVDLIGTGTGGAYSDILPGNGLYVDLDGTTNSGGKLVSKQNFDLSPGEYILSFDLAGSQRGDSNDVTVRLGNVFEEKYSLETGSPFGHIERTIAIDNPSTGTLSFENSGGDNIGLLLDNVKLTSSGCPQGQTSIPSQPATPTEPSSPSQQPAAQEWPLGRFVVHVTNDNDGTKQPPDFTIEIVGSDGGTPTPSSFPGSESGTDVELAGDGYFDLETNREPSYTRSLGSDCPTGDFPLTFTCTITFDDIPLVDTPTEPPAQPPTEPPTEPSTPAPSVNLGGKNLI